MILITGATGLVGSHLALQLLENGEKIRAIYRNQSSILATKSLFEGYKKSHLFDIYLEIPLYLMQTVIRAIKSLQFLISSIS